MAYKLIGDSCLDLDENLYKRLNISTAALSIDLDGKTYIDNDDLDTDELLEAMKKSSDVPRTACPSPQEYLDLFEGNEEDVYVVTLSSELSGSYNSAVMAREMYYEECEDAENKKNIYIFNSKSAASGETNIAFKIKELADSGLAFCEVVELGEKYIGEMNTLFVLDIIDNLEKAGRLSLIKAKLVNVLNIKLILQGNDDGSIGLTTQARGIKKALLKMINLIGERAIDQENKKIIISYVNNLERAEFVKSKIEEKYDFTEVIITPTRGISTVYANNGGIIVTF